MADTSISIDQVFTGSIKILHTFPIFTAYYCIYYEVYPIRCDLLAGNSRVVCAGSIAGTISGL